MEAQDSDHAAGCRLPAHQAASTHSFAAWSRQLWVTQRSPAGREGG